MDPVTIAALIGGASTVLGAAVSPRPMAPTVSSATAFAPFDSSGWIVATGGSRAQGTQSWGPKQQQTNPPAGGISSLFDPGPSTGAPPISNGMLLAAIGIAGVIALKKAKKA